MNSFEPRWTMPCGPFAKRSSPHRAFWLPLTVRPNVTAAWSRERYILLAEELETLRARVLELEAERSRERGAL